MARYSEENLLQLINRIYDAALDSALWPSVLLELTDAVGGSQAMMGIHDVPNRSITVMAPRMNPEDLANYRDHWAPRDILWQRTNRAPVGQLLEAERFVTRDEFVRTPIYNEWHRPLGIGVAGLGVNLFVENGVPALCGIKRPAHRDGFSREETALFAEIAPHLVRAVDMQRRLHKLKQARDAARAVADDERNCIIVVDANGQALEADPAAQRILDSNDGLHIANGVLSATDMAASARLDLLIRRCGRRDQAAPSGGSLTVSRGLGRAPLHIDVAPLGTREQSWNAEWLGLDAPSVIVAITDPEGASTVSTGRLMDRFALTPAEADLAVEIAKGDGRQAAARRLGISVGTVRSHLMRIFDKTGARRQAELVRLLAEM